MKKLLFIFVLCYVLIGCDISSNSTHNSILLFEFKPIENVNKLIIFQDLNEIHEQESVILKNYSPYDNILRIFILAIIVILVLVIVSAPLLLVYFWIHNFFEYKKSRIHIKKSDPSVKFIANDESTWSNYKNSYSALYGNGFGFFAWVLFTYFYVSFYYNDFNAGVIDYFQFPFKIMNSFSDNNLILNDHIPPKMWISMLLIVGISVGHYFLGRFIGSYISANFHKKLFFKT
ncbi:MAG: hypothetical protein Q8S41_09250 [Lutibacter sp.]|nr:hypothetical protein [Lutibacter sp.]